MSDARERPRWMLAALAIVAYGLVLHIPLFFLSDIDGRYAAGGIDMAPLTLGSPFALGWAALLFAKVRRATGTDVPADAFAAAVRHVLMLAAGFVAAFLAGVSLDPVPALLLLVQVTVLSILDVVVVPLSVAAMAAKGVPPATLLSLALIGVPSVAPMLRYVSRARRRPGTVASPA